MLEFISAVKYNTKCNKIQFVKIGNVLWLFTKRWYVCAEKKQSDKSSAIEVTAEENAVKSDSDVITKTTQKESKQKTSTAEVSLSNVNEIETLGTCGTCSKTYF